VPGAEICVYASARVSREADRSAFLNTLKLRTDSIIFAPSMDVANTAATPAFLMLSPSSGVITDPPIMTGMSEPRFPNSLSAWEPA
jgi:hypothetical protein